MSIWCPIDSTNSLAWPDHVHRLDMRADEKVNKNCLSYHKIIGIRMYMVQFYLKLTFSLFNFFLFNAKVEFLIAVCKKSLATFV